MKTQRKVCVFHCRRKEIVSAGHDKRNFSRCEISKVAKAVFQKVGGMPRPPVPTALFSMKAYSCRWGLKATFHLTISMRGQLQRAKFKGIITIIGVAGLL